MTAVGARGAVPGLLALVVAGCGGDESERTSDLCAGDLSPEIEQLCVSDRARAHAIAGEADEAVAACDSLAEGVWRDECHFLTAEVLVNRRVQDAVRACLLAGSYTGQCTSHVVWYRRSWMIKAGPSDPGAPGVVDNLVAGLHSQVRDPSRRSQFVDPVRHVRARAWYDVYYGSGSADPTAARAAADGDNGPPARSAFAWEAVRLLGTGLGPADLVHQVLAIWEGEQPPPTGATASPGCWRGWFAPGWRPSLVRNIDVVEILDGGQRLTDPDVEADLVIATLEATFAHVRGGSPDEYSQWLVDPRPTVKASAVRIASASANERAPMPALDDPGSKAIAGAVIGDIRAGWRFEPPLRPEKVECSQ